MATRPNAELTVVNNPVTSYSADWRSTCSAHALSLPLLQLSQVFLRMGIACIVNTNSLKQLVSTGVDGGVVAHQQTFE